MHKLPLIFATIAIMSIILGVWGYARSQGIAVLEPAGWVALVQRDLFVFALSLGLVALIPVFIITIFIFSKYRTAKKPTPTHIYSNWQVKSEAGWIWAGFVVLIIAILSVVMVRSTHSLDPYRSLAGEQEPMTIRVVSLPWKWLFIYPEENIATVNKLVVPEKTPISFELTADSPMSSFWIPKLGGMIYTMEGMVTQLNLAATETGEYRGVNTEINGKGYAQMTFTTHSVSQSDFEEWVIDVREQGTPLNTDAYNKLHKESIDHPVEHYSETDLALFGKILSKYMHADHSTSTPEQTTSHMEHE